MINATILSLAVKYSYSRSTFFEISKTTFNHNLNFRKFNFDRIAGPFFNSYTRRTSLTVSKSSFSHFNSGLIRISSENDGLRDIDEDEWESIKDNFASSNDNLTVSDCYFRYFDLDTTFERERNQIIYVTNGGLFVHSNHFFEINCHTIGSIIYCNNTDVFYLCNDTLTDCSEDEYQEYGNSMILGYSENHTVEIKRNSFSKIILNLEEYNSTQQLFTNRPWMIYVSTTDLDFQLNQFERSLFWRIERQSRMVNMYPIIFSPDLTQRNNAKYNAQSSNFSKFNCGQPGFCITNPINNDFNFEYMQFNNGSSFQGCFVASFQLQNFDVSETYISINYINFLAISIRRQEKERYASCIFVINGILNIENCVFKDCEGPVINSANSTDQTSIKLTLNNCVCDLSLESAFASSEFSSPSITNNTWDTIPQTINLDQSLSGLLTPINTYYATMSFTPTTPLPSPDNNDYNSSIMNSNTAGVVTTVAGIILVFYFSFLCYLRKSTRSHFYVIGSIGDEDVSSDQCILIQWWKRRHESKESSDGSDIVSDNDHKSLINKGLLDDEEDRRPVEPPKPVKQTKPSKPVKQISESESSDSGPKSKKARLRRRVSSSSSD